MNSQPESVTPEFDPPRGPLPRTDVPRTDWASQMLVAAGVILVGVAAGVFVWVEKGLAPSTAIAVGVLTLAAGGFVHLTAGLAARSRPSRRPRTATPAISDVRDEAAADAGPAVTMTEPIQEALAALASDPSPRSRANPATQVPQAAVELEPPADTDWTRELAARLQRADDPPAAAAPPPALSALRPVPQQPIPEPMAGPDRGPPPAAETEVQRVERLVKRLADTVNQRQAETQRYSSNAAPMDVPAAEVQLPLFADAGGDETGRQLTESINALRRSAEFMALGPVDQPVQAPADPAEGRRRTEILSALNAQRIDVFLEPILTLADQRPQHYEVSIALRAASGEPIDLAGVAADLSGTGLLPLIDQARIARAAQTARRLAERGKAGSVFTDLNGETLADDGFNDTFANPQGSVGAFPGQLVLTLRQAHVRTFTTADWQTLARLRAAGFAFALGDVTSLDMDFAGLVHGGFAFARLDAETFLIGLPAEGGTVPPADICRHLAGCGLALIVGSIVEDSQLARIFGFGVILGQGRLFGGARAVKAAAVSGTSATAVAAE
jgi:cyclic-di-GMP phosphodiesterase, flagellum assembly factor TipF